MSQISVTIDGRKYRLACNEGEEARLELLAGMIDEKIGEMRSSFGEIGDQRLVIMAALTLADSLTEARKRRRPSASAPKTPSSAPKPWLPVSTNWARGSNPWPRAWRAKPRLDPLDRSAPPPVGCGCNSQTESPSRTTALMPQRRGDASPRITVRGLGGRILGGANTALSNGRQVPCRTYAHPALDRAPICRARRKPSGAWAWMSAIARTPSARDARNRSGACLPSPDASLIRRCAPPSP